MRTVVHRRMTNDISNVTCTRSESSRIVSSHGKLHAQITMLRLGVPATYYNEIISSSILVFCISAFLLSHVHCTGAALYHALSREFSQNFQPSDFDKHIRCRMHVRCAFNGINTKCNAFHEDRYSLRRGAVAVKHVNLLVVRMNQKQNVSMLE